MIELANSVFYMETTPPPPHLSSSSSPLPSSTTAAKRATAKKSVSAPISPTLPHSPSSIKSAKSNLLSLSTCSTSSSSSTSPASSLSLFFSKAVDSARGADEENLAFKLRNLQITELINALLLVESKLKKEQKHIRQTLRKKDYLINKQMQEIENYKNERAKNLCGLCQKSLLGGGKADMKSVEVQTHKNLEQPQSTSEEEKQREEEVADDWYANGGSDNENDKSTIKMYSQCENPVLERVNQILLQQSMDGVGLESDVVPKIVTKRVHFSTPQASSPRSTLDRSCLAPEMLKTSTVEAINRSHMNIRKTCVSENEYEVIGSEHDSSNLYVDMDKSQSVPEVEYKNVTFQRVNSEVLKMIGPPGIPPALPPKPANLLRFRKKMVPKQFIITSDCKIERETEAKKTTEPDYCSISELSDTQKDVVQMIKEKIKEVENSVETESRASSEETNLDHIPKLPNVAEIILPKKTTPEAKVSPLMAKNSGLIINKDNYVMKHSSPIHESKRLNIDSKRYFSNPVGGIVNKSLVERRQNLLARLSNPVQASMTKRFSAEIEDSVFQDRIPPIQTEFEFEFYNLDAEYGKFNNTIKEASSPDSVSNSSQCSSDEMNNKRLLNRNLNELKALERKLHQEQRKEHDELIHYF